jgi:ribonuclease HI
MPENLTIHTDGASRGNPGAAAFAYVIARAGESPIEVGGCLGEMTNNQAEYTALVRALEHALRLGPDNHLHIHADSELMVKQMRGEYKVKNAELRDLYEKSRDLAGRFTGGVVFTHVRRELNKRADALCNEALDGKAATRPASKTPARPALHEQAIECLREAAAYPTPEEVWQKLVKVLKQHRIELPPAE